MRNSGSSIRVRHCEYIGDIPGSTTFSAVGYKINPGLSSVFPWLSGLAILYESYTVHDLKFRFSTMKSTATNGTVMGAVDFDAADAAPSAKAQMMAYKGAVRSAPWAEFEVHCAPDDLQKFKKRFVRNDTLASNLDIKTYDVGQLFIATDGEADTSTIGELYVEYDITFQTPQLISNPGSSSVLYLYLRNLSSTKTDLFGSSPSPYTGFGTDVTLATNTVTFAAAGTFFVHIRLSGTGLTTSLDTSSSTATINSQDVCVNSGGTLMTRTFTVDATAGQTLVYDASGFSSVTSSYIYISDWQNGVPP
jgi:hypothetical protein